MNDLVFLQFVTDMFTFLDIQQSPGPSAVDRFQSPITTTPVKKQLFPVNKPVSAHLSKLNFTLLLFAHFKSGFHLSGDKQGWLQTNYTSY